MPCIIMLLFVLIFNLEEHQVHRDVELQLNGGDLGWIGVGCLFYNHYIINSWSPHAMPYL